MQSLFLKWFSLILLLHEFSSEIIIIIEIFNKKYQYKMHKQL